jgi:septal ring factor EnvC (AmiA/AmiB activator)
MRTIESDHGTGNAMDTAPKARSDLAAQLARVNDEIKSYPQPIARCDAQLAGLLEERARIRAQLERLAADE